jgi:hypothetical protein
MSGPLPPRPPSRAERLAPLVAGALLALPVLLAPYPPMMDLPLHEATVAILRHRGDPSLFPPGLYFVNLGHPNQLFHLAAWALSYVASTALASRIVVAAAVLALPLAVARLADHLGASRWTAVIAAPVALGWLFIFGLVANMLGLAILVAALPSLDRFVARPDVAGAARCFAAAAALYFAHEAMLFLYLGTLGLFALAQPITVRGTALRALPVLASAVIIFAQQRYQAPLMSKAVRDVPTVYFPLGRKLVEIPQTLFAPFDPIAALAVFVVAVGAAVPFALQRARAPRPAEEPAGLRARLHARRFEVLLAFLFLGYLVTPVSIHGANLMHQRFLAPAFVLAVVVAAAGAPGGAAPPRVGVLLAAVAPVAVLLVTWPAFIESSRDHADVVRLSDRIAPSSALATVEISQDPDHVDLLRQPMAMVALSRRGGRYLYSFAESPISPIMVRPEYQWNEPVDRILTRGAGFCPSYDFTRFRYVLLYSPSGALQLVATGAMKPEGRYVGRAGSWVLYESALPVAPLLTPDGPGPANDCAGDNFNARIHRVQAELLARVRAGGTLPELPPE